MPYLPVDLDAKRKAGEIERALGLPRFSVIGGLLEVWEGVWREKSDAVDDLALGAAFGPSPQIRSALVARDFLEPLEDGRHRVRGAKKWLLGMEGRSRGGHAAKANLVPGAAHRQPKAPKPKKEASSAPAEGQPKASRTPPSAPSSALTPSIQHPAPIEALQNLAGADAPRGEQGALPGLAEEKRLPLRRQLSDALVAEFTLQRGPGHKFTSRDGKALDGILAAATKACHGDPIGEAVRRYRYGLTRTYGGLSEIHELETHWNKQAPPKSQGPPVDLRSKFPDESVAQTKTWVQRMGELEQGHG